jgi:glyoxylate reductase
MGGIGTATAKRAQAFGFNIKYHNRKETSIVKLRKVFGDSLPQYVSFTELLRTSDVISIHLPLGSATKEIIGPKEFEMMKDGVIIVNTARGSIINEKALEQALISGKVWSVGLDVYAKEPFIEPELLQHPRAVLLPHIGTATYDTQVSRRYNLEDFIDFTQKKMEILVIENVKKAITDEKLLTQVQEQLVIA